MKSYLITEFNSVQKPRKQTKLATFKAMNFLSHFYFDKENTDEHMVLGIVLPDLVKNAQKDGNLYPLKERELFVDDPFQRSILKGWARHIEVDNVFHSSEFFKLQTNVLKQMLLPILNGSPVKPFFLAHIGLELILDHLLTINNDININLFYDHLSKTDKDSVKEFLEKAGLQDTNVFFNFYNSFISSRYLLSYQKIENIAYALNRICMRLWNNPFDEMQVSLITGKLILFRDILEEDYKSIFEEIEISLRVKNL